MKKGINQLSNYKTSIARFLALFLVLAALMAPLAVRSYTFAATKPGTTTLSSVSSSAYNKVTVKWKKTSGATHYVVYYKKYGASKWTKLKTLSSKYTSYTHTSSSKYPIVVGQKYVYTVRAYNSESKKYGNYNKKGLSVTTKPNTVKLNKAALNSNGSVTVSWSKAGGADRYVVYRKITASSWQKIATLSSSARSYTDKYPFAGFTNTYTVRSYYIKTKSYGKYDTKGVSVSVPKSSADDDDFGDVEPTPKPKANPEEMAREVLRLTNEERVRAGRAPLIYNAALQRGAMVRAKEISVVFSHARPDGRDSDTALWEAGAGNIERENIAAGQNSPKAAVNAWMNSPGHRAALLASCNLYVGIGFYEDDEGEYYWVQEFADGDPDEKGTVIFDANGGVGGCTIQAPRGQIIYMKDIPVPTREGYTFGGWFITKNFNGWNPLVSVRAGNGTCYAKWE